MIQLTASFIALEALQPEAKQKRKKWCNYVYFTAYVFAANFSVQDKEQAFMCLLQFWEMRNEYKSFSFCCLASNATAAKEFCEEHECPASWKDANRENCCVYHANIHSCPLAFMVSIMVQHRVLCSCYWMRHHCNNQVQVYEVFLWLQLDQIYSSLKPLWGYLSVLEVFALDSEAPKQMAGFLDKAVFEVSH